MEVKMALRKSFPTFWIPVLLIIFTATSLSQKASKTEDSSLLSSKSCRECHVEIYDHWKNAMHSMALEDPIFQASYLEAYFNTQGEAKYNCLKCHAPATLVNKDYDLKMEVTKEGVSCDFCHSITKVNIDNKANPFDLELGKIKWGPLSKVSSPAHLTEASPLFKSSELCAGCHEYTNDKGVLILGTYSEWKRSPYASEGTTCQTCHMPLIDGSIVNSKIKSSGKKQINLHAISASHSVEQLRKAVRVEIKSINQDKDFIDVEVDVTNVGSGHWVPTGIPTRKLILWVELKTPNEYYTQQRVYLRQLADEQGSEVKKIGDIFLAAARVISDTRLKPRETRKERFIFAWPKNKKITITARVEYLYQANILSPTELRVKMSEDIRTLTK